MVFTPLAPVVHADYTNFDLSTGLGEARGHAQIQYGSALLLADEFHVDQNTGLVTAAGHFTITSGTDRLLAERGSYNLTTGVFSLSNLRAGEPPFYVTAAAAAGTRAKMTLTDAIVTYSEPGTFAPTLKADRLVYEPGKRITGENGRLGLGDFRLLKLPKFDRPVAEPIISLLTARVGYRHNLGAYVDLGLHVPVWPGINLGGDVAEYTARGLMAGPGGTYRLTPDGEDVTGSFRSGFIEDHGDRGVDLLGRPVPQARGFFEWSHQQTIGDRLTITGEYNWWKDSEILRDFHPNEFRAVQQPDSFVESVYAGDNYYVDLFTRLAPNNFEEVQERLPELRFDLLPTPIGAGFYERFNSSFSALQEDSLFSGPTLRSDRFDTFYSVERPIKPADWLTITASPSSRIAPTSTAPSGAARAPARRSQQLHPLAGRGGGRCRPPGQRRFRLPQPALGHRRPASPANPQAFLPLHPRGRAWPSLYPADRPAGVFHVPSAHRTRQHAKYRQPARDARPAAEP